ncbi:MAG: hypothetical protein R2729_20365 [Bryobacteraceae bacterium]
MTESEEPKSKQQHCSGGGCGCAGAGPAFTDFLRNLGPADEVRDHFHRARIEFLKGIRAMVDQQIRHATEDAGAKKGAKITVE